MNLILLCFREHEEGIVKDSSSGRSCSGTNEGPGGSDEVRLISVVLLFNGSHSTVH